MPRQPDRHAGPEPCRHDWVGMCPDCWRELAAENARLKADLDAARVAQKTLDYAAGMQAGLELAAERLRRLLLDCGEGK